MKVVFFLLMICSNIVLSKDLLLQQLTCNSLINPLGIGSENPIFGWKLKTGARNTLQTAYQIRVSDVDFGSKQVSSKNLVWDSGKIESSNSIHVEYGGQRLKSDQKYFWQVRGWDNHGNVSTWSTPAYFHVGILASDEWKAQWIEIGYQEREDYRPCPLFRKEFATAKKIKSANLFITSRGVYEAYLNGERVGDAWLTPGWTSYNKRLQYQVFDVSDLMKKGQNTLGVVLGNGWYRGVLAWPNHRNIYGQNLALLLQLSITYQDGSKELIVSDGGWKSSPSEISYSEIYHGETVDARKKQKGWSENAFDYDQKWSDVRVSEYTYETLVPSESELSTAKHVLKPVSILTTPKGEKVIDFGQNMVGWVKLKVAGNAGDSILLSHAEVLDKEGNFYVANLRLAKAQNTYILAGGGTETFHPSFTWQGFRYVKVEGYPGELDPASFEAVVLYSDLEDTGDLVTSHPLINQLQQNIKWGQRGNFLDIPTDCPQRDERLGWTGDAQAFAATAAYNMNVKTFFRKWLQDLEADQIDGQVPDVVPNVLRNEVNSAGWGDAATIVPWEMYMSYGDKLVLARQYNSMKAYLESVRKTTTNDLWSSGSHYGDWLFFRPFDDTYGSSAVTDPHLIAQCFYAHSIQLLINAADLLGREADVTEYTELLNKVKAAYKEEYLTNTGRLISGTQTAYVLALQFDMLPEELRAQAAERLVQNIKSYGTHLTTGFLGTPYLCHVLSKYGYWDVAYDLLIREEYPSWLYPVTKGATTIWERWDGIKPDGTFQTTTMNSFNHYAYGAIGDWMYQHLGGIQRKKNVPAYREIVIAPVPGGGITMAKGEFESPYGKILSQWEIKNDEMSMHVIIPPNAIADIVFPQNADLSSVRQDDKILELNEGKQHVGSGDYHFTFRLRK